MEKSITKLAIMMAMFMSVTIVVSCGGDDEETGGGGISDGGNNNPISTKHLVRKTWSGRHSNSGDESGTDVYIYDSNGRMKMRKKEEKSFRPDIWQYIYEDNKIVCERDYYGRCTYTYTLSNGRIVKEVKEESDGVCSYTYVYDNGYLSSIAYTYEEKYYGESYRGEYLLSWSNGNLINIIRRYYRGTDLEGEYICNYEYTNIPWPKNWIHNNHTEATNIDDVLLYSGLFGKTPKFLPSKLIKDNETYTFDYVIENGLVTKVYEDYHDSNYYEIANYVYNIYWE